MFWQLLFFIFSTYIVTANEPTVIIEPKNYTSICIAEPSDQNLPTLNDLGNQTGFYRPTGIAQQMQYASHVPTPAQLNQIQRAIIVNNLQSQHHYHMTVAQRQAMMKLSYDKFVPKLLSDESLTDKAVWELWDAYQATRWWSFSNKKQEAEIEIRHALYQRNKKQKQQEQTKKSKPSSQNTQQKLPPQTDSLKANQQNYEFEFPAVTTLNSDQKIIWQEREQALEKTKQQDFQLFSQQHMINDQVRGYLKAHDINSQEFEQLHGTTFQHHLQQEISSQLQHAAQLQDKLPTSNILLKQTTLFSHVAIAANRAEMFPIVFDVHHHNCELLKICDIMSQETWRLAGVMTETFVKEVIHTCNPVEIVKDLWSLTQLCWQHRMYNMQPIKKHSAQDLEQEELEEELRAQELQKCANDPEHLRQITELRCQQFADIMHTVGKSSLDWYAHRSAAQKSEDILKGTAVFVANVLAPDIVFERLGIALCFAGNNLKRAKQFVTLCEDEYLIATTLEEITTRIKAKELITEEKLLLRQAEKNIAAGSKIIKHAKDTYPHDLNNYPKNENSFHHLFRKKEGHVPATEENKKLILDMVRSKECFIDELNGLAWYSKINKNGEQVWACVWTKSYEIRNCGVNKTPRKWNPLTGYNRSKPLKTKGKQ